MAVSYTDGSGKYAPIVFPDAGSGWPQSSTFDHMVLWNSDSTHNPNVFAYGLGVSFGFQGYPCSNPPSGVTLTNCVNADPQFAAALPTYSNSPSSFNFSLSPSSPAAGKGTASGIPAFDLFGNPFATPPSMGAIQQTTSPSATPVAPPSVSITAPSTNSMVSGTVAASATAIASGTLTVSGVQFQLDGANLGFPITLGPAYSVAWDTTTNSNGLHTLTATATDSAGNTSTASISVTINNAVAAPPSSHGRAQGGRI